MNQRSILIMSAVALLSLASLQAKAIAQAGPENAPPSYVADPAVYKKIGENDQFLVIAVTRPAGKRDAWHSHLPLAVYYLTDCDTRIYTPDGKTRENKAQAGSVTFIRLPRLMRQRTSARLSAAS
jgi:hypothetical protein